MNTFLFLEVVPAQDALEPRIPSTMSVSLWTLSKATSQCVSVCTNVSVCVFLSDLSLLLWGEVGADLNK